MRKKTTAREIKIYERIGERVAGRRNEVGVTQSDLATASGLTRGSIANLERGAQLMTLGNLYRIARALRIPVAHLLPGNGRVHQ